MNFVLFKLLDQVLGLVQLCFCLNSLSVGVKINLYELVFNNLTVLVPPFFSHGYRLHLLEVKNARSLSVIDYVNMLKRLAFV